MRKLTATLCLALGIVFLSADANANAYEKFLCPEDFQLIQPSTTTVLDKTESIRSYDTNLRLNLWDLEEARRVINETLTQVDILLPSLDEAQILTGLDNTEDILNFYLQFEPEILALKCVIEGAIVICEGRKEYIPASNVNAIDTSGAGDTFAGAFLAQLIQGESPFEAARFAVVASGISVQGYGAMAPIPNRKQVLRAMER